MSVPRVKICGITRVQDALIAEQAGADAIGLVFYAPSSRYVNDLSLAKEIAKAVGPFTTVTALFVDASDADIEKVLREVPINLLQFHGNEDCARCERFGLPYIKALRVSDKASLDTQLTRYPSAAGLLLDTFVKGVPGGTGQRFDWALVPRNSQQALIIAGGLNPNNVVNVLQLTGAYGVDVSGGVESAPGEKDPELVRQFVYNAKRIGESRSEH